MAKALFRCGSFALWHQDSGDQVLDLIRNVVPVLPEFELPSHDLAFDLVLIL